MVKRSRKRFGARFNLKLTNLQHTNIYVIAEQANEGVADVIRRMIDRDTPFFLAYSSLHKTLPPVEQETVP